VPEIGLGIETLVGKSEGKITWIGKYLSISPLDVCMMDMLNVM